MAIKRPVSGNPNRTLRKPAFTTPRTDNLPLVHVTWTGYAREIIQNRVRKVTGMNCLVELVPPRTLPRTSSGKLSRSRARSQYLSGEIQPFAIRSPRAI